jgi:DNA-binding MarR family transcriptional regulator
MHLGETLKKCQNSFCGLIGQTARSLGRRIQRNWRDAGSEVTIEQWSIMKQLWIKDGQSQQELSVCTDRDKPCTTRLIDTMEKHNLVVRVPDQNDRRVKLIYLTHQGKELQKLLTDQIVQSEKEALDGVDEQELAVCRKVLQQICANLSTE